MAIPILYLLAARLYAGGDAEKPLVRAAHAAAVAVLVFSWAATLESFLLRTGTFLNLALALLFAQAAVFYGLEAGFRKKQAPAYAAAAMALLAVWQVLLYWQVSEGYYLLAFAGVGLVLLAAYRFGLLEAYRASGLPRAAFVVGNVLATLAFAGGALLTLNRLQMYLNEERTYLLPLALAALSLAAAWLTAASAWRRWYVAAAVGHAILAALAVTVLSGLTPAQKL
jgi:hypothetical protein